MRGALGLSLVLLLIAWAGAEPVAKQVPFQHLWRSSDLPIEIEVGEHPVSVTLNLPRLPKRAGETVCLRLAARLHTQRPAGWNHYLALQLNGVAVTPMTPERRPRLLNHMASFASSYPKYPKVPYFANRMGDLGEHALVIFFMPDISSLDERVLTERAEGGWYLLDISDLVRADAPNTLTLTNLAIKRYWGGNPPAGLRMVIEVLEVGSVPNSEVERLRERHLVKRARLRGKVKVKLGSVQLDVAGGGGAQITVRGETYFIESAFSFAGKNGIGFNELLCLPHTKGEETWRPRALRLDAQTVEVIAEGQSYRLQRRIQFNGHRLEIADTINNKTDATLGIIVRHQVLTPDFPRSLRLNGVADAVAHGAGRFPENPTLFAAQQETGLGVVAEDNALRLQMQTEASGNAVQFATKNFGIAAKASYTMRWALYPTTTDYFDFINAVRRDWNVNFTVLGPFDFVDARKLQGEDAEAIVRELWKRKGVRLFALLPWFEYYSGTDMSRSDYKALMKKAMKVIKSVVPDAKCLACIETNLTPVPLEFFQGTLPADLPYGRPGHSYPVGQTPGKYGYPAPPEAARVIDASPWRDSVMRDAQGRILLDTWYVHWYQGKALNLMVYPTLDNYWHRQMLDKIRFLLDEVGVDGCYIDQFSYAYGQVDRYTYDRWDGVTVEIDERTGKVVRQYADLALLTAAARKQWVDEILRRGGVVVANSMPAVNELQSLPIFRFMETQGYDPLAGRVPDQWRCAKGQLASPIGLGHQWTSEARAKGARFFNRTVVAHLRYGLLYYFYAPDFPSEDGEFGAVPHMFPLTPVELGEGYIVGKERIVTCVSRQFTWRAPNKPTVRLFDERGREKPAYASIYRDHDGWRVDIKLRDWWEVAIVSE